SPADGDAHAPQFLGDDLAVHVERDGERRIHLAGATGSRAIGRSDASARLTGVAGGSAIVVYRSRTGPAYVAAVPIGPGPAPPDLTAVPRGSAALRIDVIARDRAHLPAYLWRAAHPVGGVVIVHGGPALHASPAWNEKVQLLVDAGLDVLKLDYRGSTGHGAAFEALGASADRIGDVLAARDQLARAAGVPPERIIVLGESYGAGLAAAAAAEASASPTVLVSTQPLPATAAPRSGRCPVIAFHGADDDISPPPAAHTYLTRLFGDAVQWHLVPDEGHNFARTRSWAAVYAALLALRDDPCR
ncbi:MAG: alpha/beta fold hydrolase, partial [Deltaproteobacteria bacterium]